VINLIANGIIAAVAVYCVYQESGVVTAIVSGYLFLVIITLWSLYQSQKERISILFKENDTKNNMLQAIEIELEKLKRENKDLKIYSEKHEKWLDSLSPASHVSADD
jgi:hypothetical protein